MSKLTKGDFDEIKCETCGAYLGYACGDLNCLNLRCDTCFDMEDEDDE